MSRQPLRAIPIYVDGDPENVVHKKSTVKASVAHGTTVSVGKGKPRSRSDDTITKSVKTRTPPTSKGMPFAIYEDVSSTAKKVVKPRPKAPTTKGKLQQSENAPLEPFSAVREQASVAPSKEQKALSYWMELAENRRVILEQALEENKMLYDTIKELGEENTLLRKAAEEGAYFADLLEEFIAKQTTGIVHEGTQTDA